MTTTTENQLRKSSETLDKSLTNTRPYFISGTNIVNDLNGYCIQAIEDTVVAAISSNIEGDSLAGKTILAGHVWYGKIHSLTLSSGAVFVHRH